VLRWCLPRCAARCGKGGRVSDDEKTSMRQVRWKIEGDRASMARTFQDRSRLLRRNEGKRAEARDLLAPVYGWFTEGFDTLDLKEAKKVLDELSA
jgi:hypothetical protein